MMMRGEKKERKWRRQRKIEREREREFIILSLKEKKLYFIKLYA